MMYNTNQSHLLKPPKAPNLNAVAMLAEPVLVPSDEVCKYLAEFIFPADASRCQLSPFPCLLCLS